MASLVVQPASYSAKEFTSSLFRRVPADLRYTNSKYHTFLPINSISNGAQRISFLLPPFASATLWDLGNVLMDVTVAITDAEGKLPPKGSRIGCINNSMHSLFSDVKVCNYYK